MEGERERVRGGSRERQGQEVARLGQRKGKAMDPRREGEKGGACPNSLNSNLTF